jgi:DNA-binding LytR/AlgR family response regulator
MNCIIVDDDDFVRKELEYRVNQTLLLNLVGSFSNAVEASHAVMTENIDLIFLDVVMPEMSGIEFIQSLTILKPEIILISGDPSYAVDAFEYDVTDFLVKPFTYERFLTAVGKAKRNNDKKGTTFNTLDGHVFIKVSSKLIKLELNSILYIEALADYITIYTEERRYTILSTMKRIENILSPAIFFRTHNSYIVNIEKITSIENNSILIGKAVIPVSRNRFKQLMSQLKLI